jgi:4,5-DOPA dioxygenase extradiol
MSATQASSGRLPALFIGHGAPTAALIDDEYSESLRGLGRSLARPKAILVASAHRTSSEGTVDVGASPRPRTEHNFSGFQRELYDLQYPCPGSPELAASIAARLADADFEVSLDSTIGLDHGAWIPLRFLFPDADIPVIPISIPHPADPRQALKIGHRLAPLRDEGFLILGSGGVVHNLRKLRWEGRNTPPEPWALEFSQWVRGRVEAGDLEGLLNYPELPGSELAQPDAKHLLPIFFTLGSFLKGDRPATIFDGFHYTSLSMYSFLLG